jgi:type IV pilus biogenesis protein PilP
MIGLGLGLTALIAPAQAQDAGVRPGAPRIETTQDLSNFTAEPETNPLPSIAVPEAAVLDEIAKLNARIAVLRLKLEEARLNDEIDSIENSDQPAGGSQGQPFGQTMTPVHGDGLPVIQSIFGSGGKLHARLITADGKRVTAKAGDPLPGGYRVHKITPSSVEIHYPDDSVAVLGFEPEGGVQVPAAGLGGPFGGMPMPSFPN